MEQNIENMLNMAAVSGFICVIHVNMVLCRFRDKKV